MNEESLELSEYERNVKQSKHRFFEAVNDPAIEYRLQRLLNINPKVWNDIKAEGHLPKQGTYAEVLQALFSYYRNKKNSGKGQVKEKQANARDNDEFVTLSKQEKISNIRLNRAREEGVHIQNLEKRGELVSKNEEYNIISIMLQSIATILRTASDTDPALQETIDKCFVSLYRIGETCLLQVREDESKAIELLLEKPLHLQDYLENLELEVSEEEQEEQENA